MAAFAQRVSGTVRVAGASAVLSGVVVAVNDSAGRSLGRTLTDETGRYALQLPASATHVRAVRIGFRPANVTLIRGTTPDLTVDLIMERAPVVLATVRVASDASCRNTADGLLVLQLWEQARSALLSAIVARQAKPARVQLLRYERRMEKVRRLITQQQVTMMAGTSTRPVAAARSGAELARSGYSVGSLADRTFFAPDADVLFEESFAAAHCFGLTSSRDRAGEIGLTFTPKKISRDFVDVAGVMWINPQVPELVQLDYRYTGVEPEMEDAGAGGTMRFRTMANNTVFITSWSILLPRLTVTVRPGVDGRPASTRTVSELTETGGHVVSAVWTDGTKWIDPVGVVRGQVVDEKTRAPVAGVAVSTTGAGTETDASGRYTIATLPPGRYRFRMLDSAFSAFVRPRDQSREAVVSSSDTATLDFSVPSRQAILGDICRSQSRGGNTLVLLGRVRGGTGIPDQLRIEAGWFGVVPGGSGVGIAGANSSTQLVNTSSAGEFLICGVPRQGSPVTLRALVGRTTLADTVISRVSLAQATGASHAVEWILPPGVFAAATHGGASLSGRVTRNGAGVADAQVWMVLVDTTVTTDSAGRYRVAGLRAGEHMVQVRRMGNTVKREMVTLRAGQETVRDFAMDGVPELDTVRTVGAGRAYDSPRLQDFERRRLSGMGGSFIPEGELRKHESRTVADVLRTYASGVTIEEYRGQKFASSTSTPFMNARTPAAGVGSPSGCWVNVYVDGIAIYDGPRPREPNPPPPPDIGQFLAMNLSGVEYYRGGATVPLQFKSSNNPCGTLLLWTRGK